jgi:hypothetical protein
MDTVRTLLTRLGEFMATPAAFGMLLAFFSLWLTFDRASLELARRCNLRHLGYDTSYPEDRAS